MFKEIARIVVRDEGTNPAGLFIGSCFKDQDFFKPGKVYTVREILGEINIKEEGDALPAKSGENCNDAPMPGLTWASEIGDVLAYGYKFLWLTRKEYQQYLDSREDA